MRNPIKYPRTKPLFPDTPENFRRLDRILQLFAVLILLTFSSCTPQNQTPDPGAHQSKPTPTTEQIIFSEFSDTTEEVITGDGTKLEIVFEPTRYTHPENLFSLDISENWQVDPHKNGASISDPLNHLNIRVSITNTGYALTPETFENFIDIQEEKATTEFEDSILIDHQKMKTGIAYQMTKLGFLDGEEKLITTNYQQQEHLILKIDFITHKDVHNANKNIFDDIINSINIHSDFASDLSFYGFDEAKRISNGYFSILVPPFWRLDETQDEDYILQTVSSPDNLAVIQTLVFDDGNLISKSLAADFVLKLMRENYAKNIIVMKDEMLPDGREKLQWHPENANYLGETTFTTCDSSLLMITVMVEEAHEFASLYQPIIEAISASYHVDVPCD